MDRSLLLDGKQWRSKMASTAATNFQRTSGHLPEVPFWPLLPIVELITYELSIPIEGPIPSLATLNY